jgi:hypothetical protein
MPLKTIAIKFSDPEIPFEAASELLAHLTYPEDVARQRIFSDALCRYGHLAKSTRNLNWAFSAHQIRPRILVSGNEAFSKSLHAGCNRLDDFLGLSLNVFIPHAFDFLAQGNCEDVAKDTVSSLNKIIITILDRKGRSKESRSTFITNVWVPLRPVFHLAFAYAHVVFFKPGNGDYDRKGRPMYEIITPYPEKNTVLDILDCAEAIRRLLPAIPSMDASFSEDETIKFIAET